MREKLPRDYFLSARVFLPKASVVRNLRRIQPSAQYKKNNFVLNAGKMDENLFKVTVYLPFSFRKKLSAKQDIGSTEISYQFLAPKVPVLRRNKATPTPVLQLIHFQL